MADRATAFELEPQLRLFAPRLRDLMDDAGLSVNALSYASGIARMAIPWYTQGTRLPGAVSLVRLTRVFSVSSDYLLGSTTEPEPYPDPTTGEAC